MAAVELVDVVQYRGEHLVLDKLNLSVNAGEFLVVVGPSGCGKSTLLRLLAGLDSLSSGQIRINQVCVNHIPPAKRDMAMVFQNYALYPHMTVYQNMAYGLKLRGMKRLVIDDLVQNVAKMLQLDGVLNRLPDALSGGQRQRVAMGRAMVRKPSVFLFDEPLSNLDARLRTDMRHEIKKLHKSLNTTCVYVTHDQTEAMTMADRIVVLNQGRIEQIGTPKQLYDEPESLFVAGFTGHYPCNFLHGFTDERGVCLDNGGHIDIDIHADSGQAIVLGIRSEHILVSTAEDADALLFVEFIDDMGADLLIDGFLTNSQERLIVRTSKRGFCAGDSIPVSFPKNRLHLFDKHSTKRLNTL